MPRCEVAKNEMQSSLSLSRSLQKVVLFPHPKSPRDTHCQPAVTATCVRVRMQFHQMDRHYFTQRVASVLPLSSSSDRCPPWKINRSDDCTAMHWCRLQYQECSVRLQTCSAAGQCNRFTCQNFIIAANLLVDSRFVCSPPLPPRTFWPEEDQLLKRKRQPIN